MLISIIKPKCLILAFFMVVSVLGQLQASGEQQRTANRWGLSSIFKAFKDFHCEMVEAGREIDERGNASLDRQMNWLVGKKEDTKDIADVAEEAYENGDESPYESSTEIDESSNDSSDFSDDSDTKVKPAQQNEIEFRSAESEEIKLPQN